MASGIQRLDEDGLPRVVAQNRSDRGDVALQHLWLNVRLRPQRVEELLASHESPGVLDEIAPVSSRNGENPTLPDDSATAARLGHVERASISAFILVRWVAAG
jgi:hypothetical protein